MRIAPNILGRIKDSVEELYSTTISKHTVQLKHRLQHLELLRSQLENEGIGPPIGAVLVQLILVDFGDRMGTLRALVEQLQRGNLGLLGGTAAPAYPTPSWPCAAPAGPCCKMPLTRQVAFFLMNVLWQKLSSSHCCHSPRSHLSWTPSAIPFSTY